MGTARIEYLDKIRAEKAGITVDEVKKNTIKNIPLGRYGIPAEYGRVTAFLCSEANTYITGQIILVDGGMVKAY
jgi:3-oxoacyl-[acyl-carrier protein] reductase